MSLRTVPAFVSVMAVVLGVGGSLSAQVLVQASPAPGGDARWTYSSPNGQTLTWLMYPQIQSELDLVDDQKSAVEKIRNEMNAKLQEGYKELSSVEPAERQKKYFEMYTKVGQETDKKIEEVLLPHQLKRIKQIALQMRLANSGYGSAAALHSGDVAKEIGLTPEQLDELKKRETELRQEIQEKTREFYRKLNEESREKLMSVLTSAQRQKLKDLEGDKFEWKPYSPPGATISRAATEPKPADEKDKK